GVVLALGAQDRERPAAVLHGDEGAGQGVLFFGARRSGEQRSGQRRRGQDSSVHADCLPLLLSPRVRSATTMPAGRRPSARGRRRRLAAASTNHAPWLGGARRLPYTASHARTDRAGPAARVRDARAPERRAVRRGVGVPGAVAMGLGSVLGTGIFVSIGLAAEVAGSAVIAALAIAAGVAALNGLSSAQLAALHPVS